MDYKKLSRVIDMANLPPKRTGLPYQIWYSAQEPRHKPRIKVNHGVFCPHCNSTKVKKSGFTNDGRQLYICSDCNYKFTLNNKFNHVLKKDKKLIIMYGLGARVPSKDLANMIGCCEKTVRNIKRRYLERVNKDATRK